MRVTAFGRELKRLRSRKGLTIRALAQAVGKSHGYVAKLEVQGEIPNPQLICEIARALDEDPEPLLGLAKKSALSHAEREIAARHASALRFLRRGGSSRVGSNQQPAEEIRMATTVSLINMKGGVGKTTLAMQLAHAADHADLKVLAIDLDPQSNLSQALMGPKDYVAHLQKNRPTVAQVFDEYVPAGGSNASPTRLNLDNIILKKAGYWSNSTLDLIPSRLELSRTLKNPTGKERRLAKAIAQVADRYDLILIDCAPTESILTEAAYFASRYLIVPIKPEFMATIGLPLLARSLEEFKLENDDHEIDIAGLVFNHSSTYSTGPEGQQSIAEVTKIADDNGWHVFEHQMRYSASYAKAAREQTPLQSTSYARTDVVAGFTKLKDEIFDALGVSKVTT